MIAKENINNAVIPNLSLPDGKTLNYLLDAIIAASEPFKKASNQSNLVKPLNENKLTQILVEQIEVKIKPHPFIGVKNQYSDLFCRTTGIPDFYFHVVEEGVAHLPLMIVESKRLPSPTYEKEYVIGQNKNGGIERFKLEKHGKGVTHCGIVGFIEDQDISFWLTSINNWIKELSDSEVFWNEDEVLVEIKKHGHCVYLKSIVHTLSAGDKILQHLLIT